MALSVAAPLTLVESAAEAAPLIGTRISAADGPSWSAAYARANWGPGVPTVVLVRSQFPDATAIATPLAAMLDAPLLTIDGSGGSQDTASYAALDYLKPQRALLIGPSWTPKYPAYGAVAQRVPSLEPVNGPGWIGLSQVVAQKFSASSSAALASGGATADTSTATSAAAALKVPLILTEPGYSTTFYDGAVNELKRLGAKQVIQVGPVPDVEAAAFSKPLQSANIDLSSVIGETPEKRSSAVVNLLEAKNVNTRKLYIAPSSRPVDALNAAAAVAKDRAFLRLTSGPDIVSADLRDQVSAWGSEATKVVLVGDPTGLSAAFESSINSLVKQRIPKPEFSVNSSGLTTNGAVSVTLTPKSGATAYSVYDLNGSLVASGPTPSFQLPALTTTFKVQALNGAQVLAERDVRVSEGSEKTGQPDRIVTSAYSGMVTLNWSEAAAAGVRPHKVFRASTTRAADGQLQQSENKLIGITCASEFTDAAPTDTLQNVYSVEAFGAPIGNLCIAASPAPSDTNVGSMTGLNIPSNISGAASTSSLMTSAARGAVAESSEPPRATPSLGEAALLSARTASSGPTPLADGVSAQAAIGPVLPWTFRYRMFLEDGRVRPVKWDSQVMYGDGRGFSAWAGTHRTQVDTTFYFDSQWRATGAAFSKNVGQSIQYSCPTSNDYNGCTETGRRTASDAGISTSYQTFPFPRASVNHSVGDPFPVHGFSWFGDVYAPPIRYNVQYNYLNNGFWLTGALSCAPAQEIWGGYVPGEWQPILTYKPVCALAVGAAAGAVIPFVFKM